MALTVYVSYSKLVLHQLCQGYEMLADIHGDEPLNVGYSIRIRCESFGIGRGDAVKLLGKLGTSLAQGR